MHIHLPTRPWSPAGGDGILTLSEFSAILEAKASNTLPSETLPRGALSGFSFEIFGAS